MHGRGNLQLARLRRAPAMEAGAPRPAASTKRLGEGGGPASGAVHESQAVDLDARVLGQAAHLDARPRGRLAALEGLRVDGVDRAEVLEVGEEDGAANGPVQARPGNSI